MSLIKFLTFLLWKFRKLEECCIRILGHPVHYVQMSYISMSGPSCKKMAFVMGLSLNKSSFPFPGFPALCAQGWVPIQSRRFCALFLLEMWAREKRKASRKQHSWTGCEHTSSCPQGSHCHPIKQTFTEYQVCTGIHIQPGTPPRGYTRSSVWAHPPSICDTELGAADSISWGITDEGLGDLRLLLSRWQPHCWAGSGIRARRYELKPASANSKQCNLKVP